MTWRTTAWSGPFRWLLLGILLLFAGIAYMIWRDESASLGDRIVGSVSLPLVVLLITSLHNWLTITDSGVRIGYFPFYRRTIPFDQIREIRRVRVQPIGQYGGWGLKGAPRSRHGMLLGGHPPTAIRIETTDDKRYASTFYEDDLNRIISALQARGCKLSAEYEP